MPKDQTTPRDGADLCADAQNAPDTAAADRTRSRGRRTWPGALLAAFALLSWQVATHGPVTGLDIRVRDRVQEWAAEPALSALRPVGHALADLGSLPIALPVLLFAAALAVWRAHGPRPAALTAGALAALTAVVPLKFWAARPGPGQIAVGRAALGFFPSGHTADAVICYGMAALLLCGWVLAGPLARRAARSGAAALVVLTIAGLLWSDYHWLSDTLASLCWGGAALTLLAPLVPEP